MFFDQASSRWFAAIFDITLSSERLAVSATSDPTGLFHVYNTPAGGCPDQGKVGVSDNVVAISANEFSSFFVNPVFQGVIITVLNKAQLVAGAPLIDSSQTARLPYSSSVVPAQSMNSTTTQWYAGVDDASSTVAHVVKTVGTPPATVTISEPFTPAIKKLTTPPNADQTGTAMKVVTDDNRVQTVAWQSGLLYFTTGDGCIPRRDTITRACVRLLVFNTARGLVKVDKDRSKRNQHLFYPAGPPEHERLHRRRIRTVVVEPLPRTRRHGGQFDRRLREAQGHPDRGRGKRDDPLRRLLCGRDRSLGSLQRLGRRGDRRAQRFRLGRLGDCNRRDHRLALKLNHFCGDCFDRGSPRNL